jgi:hypothetical protein
VKALGLDESEQGLEMLQKLATRHGVAPSANRKVMAAALLLKASGGTAAKLRAALGKATQQAALEQQAELEDADSSDDEVVEAEEMGVVSARAAEQQTKDAFFNIAHNFSIFTPHDLQQALLRAMAGGGGSSSAPAPPSAMGDGKIPVAGRLTPGKEGWMWVLLTGREQPPAPYLGGAAAAGLGAQCMVLWQLARPPLAGMAPLSKARTLAVMELHFGDPQGSGVYLTDLCARGSLSSEAAGTEAGVQLTFDAITGNFAAAANCGKFSMQQGWLGKGGAASGAEAADYLATSLAICADLLMALSMVAYAFLAGEGQVTQHLPHGAIPCLARSVESLQPLLASARQLVVCAARGQLAEAETFAAVVRTVGEVHHAMHTFYQQAFSFGWSCYNNTLVPYVLPVSAFMDFSAATSNLAGALRMATAAPVIAALTARAAKGAASRTAVRAQRPVGSDGSGGAGGGRRGGAAETTRLPGPLFSFLLKGGFCVNHYKGICTKGASCLKTHRSVAAMDAEFAGAGKKVPRRKASATSGGAAPAAGGGSDGEDSA